MDGQIGIHKEANWYWFYIANFQWVSSFPGYAQDGAESDILPLALPEWGATRNWLQTEASLWIMGFCCAYAEELVVGTGGHNPLPSASRQRVGLHGRPMLQVRRLLQSVLILRSRQTRNRQVKLAPAHRGIAEPPLQWRAAYEHKVVKRANRYRYHVA